MEPVAETVLDIQNLTFGYRADRLLYQNFSLRVRRGEIVTILGPSGSGKSTLFELIAGFLKPLGGVIEKAPFSQVFQDPYSSFHPSFSLINQIQDVADTSGMASFCQRMGFDIALLEKLPHELSGGQLQRASILRALLMRPRLLLADEPTSALDNLIQLDVMRMLVESLEEVGILLITHDEDLAKWCSDKIIRLGA